MLKNVQQTVTEGFNDLTANNAKNKSSQLASINADKHKQKASKQISIRGIPLVKLLNSLFTDIFRLNFKIYLFSSWKMFKLLRKLSIVIYILMS